MKPQRGFGRIVSENAELRLTNDIFWNEMMGRAVRNPFGVDGAIVQRDPRVAAARQPWAALFEALRANGVKVGIQSVEKSAAECDLKCGMLLR
jgi:hypothetical protein